MLCIESLDWQASDPIGKHFFQQNLILSDSNSWKFFMRYAKPSKLSFAVENSTFIEVYIRFSHSVLNFLFQYFLQSQLHALITWKFLMNMLKKQYLDVSTLQLEKSLVTLAIIIEWVPQKKKILPEGSQKFSKTSRRLTRSPSLE